MTLEKALRNAIATLETTATSSATLDAEVLLSFVLKMSRAQLLGSPDRPLTPTQYAVFSKLIRRRVSGWPVAYLTGHKEFYGLDFIVTEDALIPRPETETLIDVILKSTPRAESPTIFDVGTGSGCIAITLARYLPHAKITALDISQKVLAIAKRNARSHRVLKRISFYRSDLLSKVQKKRADIIVANLPYLTSNQLRGVPHEPKLALDGGKMGLELVERLLQDSPKHLNKGGRILLEIDPRQVEAIRYVIEGVFPMSSLTFAADLAGRERVARIQT